jgi:hypothetical protein
VMRDGCARAIALLVAVVPLAAAARGHQIFDLTCPFDLTSTSTIARS